MTIFKARVRTQYDNCRSTNSENYLKRKHSLVIWKTWKQNDWSCFPFRITSTGCSYDYVKPRTITIQWVRAPKNWKTSFSCRMVRRIFLRQSFPLRCLEKSWKNWFCGTILPYGGLKTHKIKGNFQYVDQYQHSTLSIEIQLFSFPKYFPLICFPPNLFIITKRSYESRWRRFNIFINSTRVSDFGKKSD